jgi:hypothetical protein
VSPRKVNWVFWPVAGAAVGAILGFTRGEILGWTDARGHSILVTLFNRPVHETLSSFGSLGTAVRAWQFLLFAVLAVVGAAAGAAVAGVLHFSGSPAKLRFGLRERLLLLLLVLVSLAAFLLRWFPGQERFPYSIIRSNRPDAIKVLFIGNSMTFSSDCPRMFATLTYATNPRREATVAQVVAPGLTLEEHWNRGEALRAIREGGPWDFVVLQEQSSRTTAEWEQMLAYVRSFHEEIEKVGARTVVFATSPRADASPVEWRMRDAGLAVMTREVDALVAPCAHAWAVARKRHPDLALYAEDRYHPGPHGTYLCACVLYATLTSESPDGSPHRLLRSGDTWSGDAWVDLPADAATDIQGIARQTVQAGEQIRAQAVEGLQKAGTIRSINARAALLLFFEAGDKLPADTEIEFHTRFAQRDTRHIGWVLSLRHPAPGLKIDVAVDEAWYGPDGKLVARNTTHANIAEDWDWSYHQGGGRGWSRPGNWPAGGYRVELSVQGEKLASGTFRLDP